MKKITKALICVGMCLPLSGCFSSLYTKNATNQIPEVCTACKETKDIESLVDNVESVMQGVNAVKGSYTLVNTKHTYNINFDTITKDKKTDWNLYATTTIDDKDITFYLNKGKFYVVYPNNGANIIIKDTMTNLVSEAESSLELLNATYNKDNLPELLTGDKLSGFNFEGMKESASYVKNNDGSYTITYHENDLDWEYEITSNYLIKEARCSAINFTSSLKLTFPKDLKITYPIGLDFLTLNIKDVKKMLEIDSFAELIDESINESE